MDYLTLKSAKSILQMVASNDGAYSWYNIVKTVDQIDDVEKVPPAYEVLKELTRLNYLQIDSSTIGNSSKYCITRNGLALLHQEA
jgi:Fe2+ or Zn2+ uptake regulation protein